MGRIIIEILHMNRHRKDYKIFEKSEVRVGRGFNNDLIISDPFISPEHIIIRSDADGWVVEDLESENGVYVKKHKRVMKQAQLESGDIVSIGRTRLRVLSPDHQIEMTATLAKVNPMLKVISHPLSMFIILLITSLIYVLDSHLSSYENLSTEKLIFEAVQFIVIIVVLAGFWAFVGRMIKHRAYFSAQASVIALFFLLILPAINLSTHLGYLFANSFVEAIIMISLSGIIFTLGLIRNLAIATNISSKARIIASTCITSLIVGVLALSYLAGKNEWKDSPRLYAELKPPMIEVKSSKSINQFIIRSEKIFDIKLDKK